MKQKNVSSVLLMCSFLFLALQHFVIVFKTFKEIQIAYIPLLVTFLGVWANEKKDHNTATTIIRYSSVITCVILLVSFALVYSLQSENMLNLIPDMLVCFGKRSLCVLVGISSCIQIVCYSIKLKD